MKKFLLGLLVAALASSALCARSLSEIKSSGVLRIGVYDAQPPFSTIPTTACIKLNCITPK